MDENEVGEKILGCALAVHKALGPGLLESYLLNFNVPLMRDGIYRLANKL